MKLAPGCWLYLSELFLQTIDQDTEIRWFWPRSNPKRRISGLRLFLYGVRLQVNVWVCKQWNVHFTPPGIAALRGG